MLTVGLQLVREKGLRKMTVSDITARTGIGKGTFYHFYPSKEYYLYDVIQYSKRQMKQAMEDAVLRHGALDRAALSDILAYFSFNGERNIIHFIPDEDMRWLLDRLPPEYKLNSEKEAGVMNAIFAQCRGLRDGLNYHLIANMMKIMAITAENRDMLHADALDENLRMMREQMLDYMFGRQTENGSEGRDLQ